MPTYTDHEKRNYLAHARMNVEEVGKGRNQADVDRAWYELLGFLAALELTGAITKPEFEELAEEGRVAAQEAEHQFRRPVVSV